MSRQQDDDLCYVDLGKFIDMLETKKLYFRRLDSLDDPFEGTYPKSYFKATADTWDRRTGRLRLEPDIERSLMDEFQKMLTKGDNSGLRDFLYFPRLGVFSSRQGEKPFGDVANFLLADP